MICFLDLVFFTHHTTIAVIYTHSKFISCSAVLPPNYNAEIGWFHALIVQFKELPVAVLSL